MLDFKITDSKLSIFPERFNRGSIPRQEQKIKTLYTMNIKRQKNFANGTVYCLELNDGKLIETTDTFLPYYTKDAIGRKQNKLDNYHLADRSERWMIGVSVMSGCPVRCKFCATGQMKGYRNLSADEIVEAVAIATQAEIENGAACGQLAIITEN